MVRSRILSLVFSASAVCGLPTLAFAQSGATTVGIPVMTGSIANGGVGDIAYDDKHGLYLQVWGHPTVRGRFVDANGHAMATPDGQGFVIAQQSGSDSLPNVSYSAGDASDDVFMVTFTSEMANGRRVFGRLVTHDDKGTPILGSIFPVAQQAGANDLQVAGGIAFDAGNREFFTTWHGLDDVNPGSGMGIDAWGRLWQLNGTTTPTDVSGYVNVSNSPFDQGTPNVAFDPQHHKYMVVYRGQRPDTNQVYGSWGRIISFDGGYSSTGVINLGSASAEPAEQNVVYLPEVDQFLAFWTEITSGRDLLGSIWTDAGANVRGTFPILATASNEGAGDADYNPTTHSVMVVAMRDATMYAQGVELTGSGSVVDYFQATTALPSPTGGIETLYPHVAAAPGGRFGIGYINNFQFSWTEIKQGTTVAPPCGVTLGSTFGTAGPNGISAAIAVTTDPAGCAWSAASNASWIQVTTDKGTGNGSVNYSVGANTSAGTRAGTLTIGGQTFTMTQCGATVTSGVPSSPTTMFTAAAAGDTSVPVSVSTACSWAASTDASWITFPSGGGTNSGDLKVHFDANSTSTSRLGQITLGGSSVTVFQQADASALSEKVVVGFDAVRGPGVTFGVFGGSPLQQAPQNWQQLPGNWASRPGMGAGLHAAVGDVDGDGRDEVVVGLTTGSGGWIVVLDDATRNYQVLDEFQVQWGLYDSANGDVYPAVGDLDGDGKAEIAVGLGVNGAGWVEIFDHFHGTDGIPCAPNVDCFPNLAWRRVNWGSYNLVLNGAVHPAIGDLDGDGKAELVLGLGTRGAGWLEVMSFKNGITGALSTDMWLQVNWPYYNSLNGETWPAIGDLKGDGTGRLVVGMGTGGAGWVYVLSNVMTAPTEKWLRVDWAAYNGWSGAVHPAVGNVDGDGAAEIVLGFDNYGAGWLEVLDDENASYRELPWLRTNWPFMNATGAGTFPAVGKLR